MSRKRLGIFDLRAQVLVDVLLNSDSLAPGHIVYLVATVGDCEDASLRSSRRYERLIKIRVVWREDPLFLESCVFVGVVWSRLKATWGVKQEQRRYARKSRMLLSQQRRQRSANNTGDERRQRSFCTFFLP